MSKTEEKSRNKNEKKNVKMVKVLCRNELNLIRGGDEQNTESDEKK